MKISKGFFKNAPYNIHIPNQKFIIGICIGLIYSFIFYSLMYLSREIFRILSVTYTYDLLILTTKEVNFYNLVFAFISAIIGQSMTLVFWFDQPAKVFEKRNFRRFSIINDQRSFNWTFIFWFTKFAVLFGVFYAETMKGGFYVFSLYPNYNYLFILIIIALFLNTWLTLRLTYKRKGFKWMLISFVAISILAFCLSKINFIDYTKINQKILRKNISNQYDLELPETDYYEKLDMPSLLEEIYFVKNPGKSESSKPLIIADKEIITLNQVTEKVKLWQSTKDYCDVRRMIYYLYIDKTINMKFVNELKNELAKSGLKRIAYAIVPSHRQYDKRFYSNLGLLLKINNNNISNTRNSQLVKEVKQKFNKISIEQSVSGLSINDSSFNSNQLKSVLIRHIKNNPNYLIIFNIRDTTSFSSYITVLSSAMEAIFDSRNEYSRIRFSKMYTDLNENEIIEVNHKFPFFWLESTNEDDLK